MENEYPIAARAITKCYGRKRLALDAVTLTVRAGEVYALVGENGAGKSTLMHIVVGLSRAMSGMLSLFGRTDARGLRASRARIGYVPDECGAYQNMSARDNLAVRCAEWNLPKSEIEHALRLVDLADTGRLKVKRFSMGMKRRLDIATALLGNSELIVMDEPINGLDPLGVVEMREVIRRLHREEGKTILISSHNLDELQKVSTCYGFISHGHMLQEASSDELARRCALGFKLGTDDQARTIELLARAYPSVSVTPYGRDAVLVQGAEGHFDQEDAVARVAAAGVRIREARFESLALEDYYRALMQGEGLESSMDRDENGVRAAA